jgi:hypothetical protein
MAICMKHADMFSNLLSHLNRSVSYNMLTSFPDNIFKQMTTLTEL